MIRQGVLGADTLLVAVYCLRASHEGCLQRSIHYYYNKFFWRKRLHLPSVTVTYHSSLRHNHWFLLIAFVFTFFFQFLFFFLLFLFFIFKFIYRYIIFLTFTPTLFIIITIRYVNLFYITETSHEKKLLLKWSVKRIKLFFNV